MNLIFQYGLAAAFAHLAMAAPVVGSPAGELLQREAEIRSERVKADPRYSQTRLLCENNLHEYGWVLKESASDVLLLSSGNASAWTRFFENNRIAPEILDLLESDAFNQALLDCGKISVIHKIAAADYAGKVVGLAATYAVLRFTGPLLARTAILGRAGPLIQRSAVILLIGYTVHQALSLNQIISNRNSTDAQSKELVAQKTRAMRQNVDQLRHEFDEVYREELVELEAGLLRHDLSESDRATIREKIERIRFALNANQTRR